MQYVREIHHNTDVNELLSRIPGEVRNEVLLQLMKMRKEQLEKGYNAWMKQHIANKEDPEYRKRRSEYSKRSSLARRREADASKEKSQKS